MSFPGPDCLGRGVVVRADAPVPAPFAGCDEVRVDARTVAEPGRASPLLHAAWAGRKRVVIRLADGVADLLRTPETNTRPPYALGAGFEFARERLAFLVWANNYDATQGEPSWRLAAHAIGKLGARPSTEADIRLPDGTHAWCDGGPRGGLPIAVVHGESLALGRLALTSPADTRIPAADLADDQRRAVLHASGAARVIAPAGSGKTRVLAARLRHLLGDRGYEPDVVTAVAYNKRAATELEQRVSGLGARVKTLHALGWEILRAAGDPKLLSERDVRDRVMRLGRKMGLSHLEPQKGKDPLAAWVEALAEVRLGLQRPEDVEMRRDEELKGFTAFFDRYRALLADENACDHDEQIYGAVEHLLATPEARRRVQRQCRHLLVDEFQDLTPAYMLLVRLLSAPGYQVFGVGDDDQVIYGYLGATPDYLIRYKTWFPAASEYALETNYRCHPKVVDGADKLLKQNRRRVAKHIIAAAPESGAGLIIQPVDAPDMAALVVTTVNTLIEKGHRPENIAVLTRVNDSLLPVQLALHDAGVPCNRVVDAALLDRAGVRAALAWLALACGADKMPGGLLAEAMTRPSRKVYRATIDSVAKKSHFTSADWVRFTRPLKEWERNEVLQFVTDLQKMRKLAAHKGTTLDLLRTLRLSMGLGGEMDALDQSRSDASGSNHVDQLLALEQVAALHPDPTTFEAWLRDELAAPAERGGVTLSTVHRVKGMEWDIVIVFNANEGLMPHRLSRDSSGQIEEERRVFHVAITRGRRTVIVFTDKAQPSRFVRETGAVDKPHRETGPAARREVSPIKKPARRR